MFEVFSSFTSNHNWPQRISAIHWNRFATIQKNICQWLTLNKITSYRLFVFNPTEKNYFNNNLYEFSNKTYSTISLQLTYNTTVLSPYLQSNKRQQISLQCDQVKCFVLFWKLIIVVPHEVQTVLISDFVCIWRPNNNSKAQINSI